MNKDSIDFDRLNYLISLKISNINLSKRLYRAKKDTTKSKEYILLSIVKGLRSLEDYHGSEQSE